MKDQSQKPNKDQEIYNKNKTNQPNAPHQQTNPGTKDPRGDKLQQDKLQQDKFQQDNRNKTDGRK